MDIDGFPALVDLVGGVDVINPKPIHDPFSHTELPAGPSIWMASRPSTTFGPGVAPATPTTPGLPDSRTSSSP
jgi:hypothetical protein